MSCNISLLTIENCLLRVYNTCNKHTYYYQKVTKTIGDSIYFDGVSFDVNNLVANDFDYTDVTSLAEVLNVGLAACVGSSSGGTPTTGDSTAANQQLIIQELQNLITLLTPNTETVVEVIHLNTVGVYDKSGIMTLANNTVSEIHSISVSSYTGNPIFEHPIGQTPSTIKQSGNRLISGDTRLNNVEPIDGDFELTIAAGDEALLVVTFIK